MSKQNQRWLRIEQLDRRTAVWRMSLQQSPPPRKGWIHALRNALGMTHEQLAKRMGVAKSRVGQIELAEVNGSLTLSTFRKALAALSAQPAIGAVPDYSLEEIVGHQADRVAKQLLARVHHTMSLEAQATSSTNLERERKRLKEEILAGPWRNLWH